jgi:cytoskeleton protein RodZ
LTVEQAAAQLRMQPRIIEALESDDYSALPGSTFVRGYLRSYSRLLGLPEENIVALAPLDGIKDALLVCSISEGDEEVSSSDLPFRMMSFLILVVVVVGLGWWLSQRELALDSTPIEMGQPGAEQGLLLPEEAVQPDGEVPSVNTESDSEAADNAPVETEAVAEKGDDEKVVPLQQPVVEPPPAVSVAAVRRSPAVLTAETPQSQIELEYQADSWSEISDAAGRKLAYGIISAGTKLKLQGEAPFKVFLGYARGVTIYYNGELYDHTAFHDGDLARFRIGRAEHNRPGSR